MKLAKEDVLRIVRKLRDELAAVYGGRLKGVYLYGSYSRGDAGEDSDIDVAVVLAEVVNRADEVSRTIEIISDTCLQENCLVVPFFLSETEYEKRPYEIYRSIARDGISV